MRLFEDLSPSSLHSALIGMSAIFVTMAASRDEDGFRPLMKSIVKGGILLYDKSKEIVAQVGEQLSDLMAEVRSEEGKASSADSQNDPAMRGAARRPKSQRRTKPTDVRKGKSEKTE
jgi:hypothetical protein